MFNIPHFYTFVVPAGKCTKLRIWIPDSCKCQIIYAALMRWHFEKHGQGVALLMIQLKDAVCKRNAAQVGCHDPLL
eukprot:scaffold7382_cov406-Prasinococcus_capsulatus_cf.AAC.29